jgi:hypothetical protein
VRNPSLLAVLAVLVAATPSSAKGPQATVTQPELKLPAGDNDQTLRALRDEMERSRTRLALPGVDMPFYVEYRLLDLDVRTVTASFGALLNSSTARSRQMIVDVRVGNYHLDSSNFISEDGFQGFLGRSGQVGIDRDYNSLRQDLWLATDQAYKEAVTQMSLKQAFLRSLTKPPEIDDFAQAEPVVKVEPRIEPDWSSRNWEQEARTASAVLKNFAPLYGTRVTYSLIYTTSYLMTSEGTIIRTSRHFAAIEAGMDTTAEDGMPLSNFYAVYTADPSGLPDAAGLSGRHFTSPGESQEKSHTLPGICTETVPSCGVISARGSREGFRPAAFSGTLCFTDPLASTRTATTSKFL